VVRSNLGAKVTNTFQQRESVVFPTKNSPGKGEKTKGGRDKKITKKQPTKKRRKGGNDSPKC